MNNFLNFRDMALVLWGKRSLEVVGHVSWHVQSSFQFRSSEVSAVCDVIPHENEREAQRSVTWNC